VRKILAIAYRDLQSLFFSLRAYVVITILMLLFGIFFYLHLSEAKEATMREMFQLMNFLFLFIIPIITMGSLADERRAGTLELLLTCPVSRFHVVAGKFLAAATFFTIVVALTVQFYGLMALSGRPDPGPVLSGYVGILLSGYLFVAVGIYASSLTKSPLVAALISYAALLSCFIVSSIPNQFSKTVADLIAQVGITQRIAPFERGLIQTSDVLYFLLGTSFWIGITTTGFALEKDNPLA
jgi:ABC-2 type transport system permease protein